jgi:hypothetical protein
METTAITIRVAEEAARVYLAASPQDQRKIDAILSLRLSDLARRKRPLEELMAEISREAQQRGLTLEIMESILNAP